MLSTFALTSLFGLATANLATPQLAERGPATTPSLTLQFTPHMPTHTPPVSTVWGAIMTSFLNVVDCDYVMVENIDNNPVQYGTYTTKTTSMMMTIYQIGCMPQTTAVTRRDFKDSNVVDSPMPQTAGNQVDSTKEAELIARVESKSHMLDRVATIAEQVSTGIDPNNDNMTVRDFNFLRQINTALFALNVVNSGMPLKTLCDDMHNAPTALNLDQSLIDASQAANIICFASQYGIFFNMSNSELLSDLAALEYAIQMKDYGTQTLQELCTTLNYQAASFLGIDIRGIQNYVCDGTPGVPNSTAGPSESSTRNSTDSSMTTATPVGTYTPSII